MELVLSIAFVPVLIQDNTWYGSEHVLWGFICFLGCDLVLVVVLLLLLLWRFVMIHYWNSITLRFHPTYWCFTIQVSFGLYIVTAWVSVQNLAECVVVYMYGCYCCFVCIQNLTSLWLCVDVDGEFVVFMLFGCSWMLVWNKLFNKAKPEAQHVVTECGLPNEVLQHCTVVVSLTTLEENVWWLAQMYTTHWEIGETVRLHFLILGCMIRVVGFGVVSCVMFVVISNWKPPPQTRSCTQQRTPLIVSHVACG